MKWGPFVFVSLPKVKPPPPPPLESFVPHITLPALLGFYSNLVAMYLGVVRRVERMMALIG